MQKISLVTSKLHKIVDNESSVLQIDITRLLLFELFHIFILCRVIFLSLVGLLLMNELCFKGRSLFDV